MKLNPDCIRDILLTVEDLTDFSHYIHYKEDNNVFPQLSNYTHKEIVYHIRQCEMSRLITNVHYYDAGTSISIQDLSPLGHEFLSNIRTDNIWNHTKRIADKVGSYSLDVLTKISTGVVTQMIKQQFLT